MSWAQEVQSSDAAVAIGERDLHRRTIQRPLQEPPRETGKTVGWATREFALDAVLMALSAPAPEENRDPFRSGNLSTAVTHGGAFFRAHRLQPSMSRRDNCWLNAVAESFFGSLKEEQIKKRTYKNREIAAADISAYIEQFYNPLRRIAILPA